MKLIYTDPAASFRLGQPVEAGDRVSIPQEMDSVEVVAFDPPKGEETATVRVRGLFTNEPHEVPVADIGAEWVH